MNANGRDTDFNNDHGFDFGEAMKPGFRPLIMIRGSLACFRNPVRGLETGFCLWRSIATMLP